ncbi:MAG: hypothetical protein II997_05685 [Clostridia bacterium]|nr:hypothetical protein [Clostridia bacterium]
MKDLTNVDKNFKLKTEIDKKDIVFYDTLNPPFEINGLIYENGKFRRMPEEAAKSVTESVHILHAHTAGGRVRFKTNSPYIAINAEMGYLHKMSRFAMTGSLGFDMYIKYGDEERYCKTFIPPFAIVDGYTSIIELETKEDREITINFPLYSEVCKLYIGVSEDAYIDAPSKLTISKPIVFYGSSITQGCSASRPGCSYESIIARRFNCDYINLGFSGSAGAEKEIADYIKKLDMSMFVYDYDHNAPSVQFLIDTHERMFNIIREENPDLPIVMMSRPKIYLNQTEKERREVIRTTYEKAIANGDKNVYFIPGNELMKYTDNGGTVDNDHPNDLGFASMAKVLGDTIETILHK